MTRWSVTVRTRHASPAFETIAQGTRRALDLDGLARARTYRCVHVNLYARALLTFRKSLGATPFRGNRLGPNVFDTSSVNNTRRRAVPGRTFRVPLRYS